MMNCSIEESFIHFIDSHDKTGEGRATETIEKLTMGDLKIEDYRGQGYDNNANIAYSKSHWRTSS